LYNERIKTEMARNMKNPPDTNQEHAAQESAEQKRIVLLRDQVLRAATSGDKNRLDSISLTDLDGLSGADVLAVEEANEQAERTLVLNAQMQQKVTEAVGAALAVAGDPKTFEFFKKLLSENDKVSGISGHQLQNAFANVELARMSPDQLKTVHVKGANGQDVDPAELQNYSLGGLNDSLRLMGQYSAAQTGKETAETTIETNQAIFASAEKCIEDLTSGRSLSDGERKAREAILHDTLDKIHNILVPPESNQYAVAGDMHGKTIAGEVIGALVASVALPAMLSRDSKNKPPKNPYAKLPTNLQV